MKWSDFEKHLKASHLGGRRVTVTISRIVIEETHPRPGKTEKAPVAYFEGKEKGLILSPTNCRKLSNLFGEDVDKSVGQTVAIEAVTVNVGREAKHPIRIFHAEQKANAVQSKQFEPGWYGADTRHYFRIAQKPVCGNVAAPEGRQTQPANDSRLCFVCVADAEAVSATAPVSEREHAIAATAIN